MKEVYQNEEDTNVVGDMLDALVREGARRMLAAGLEEEVNGFLGQGRYERGEEFRGYRNGYHPSRELTVGVSAVEVKVPRVSDVPAEVSANGFEPKIVKRYERTSRQTQDQFRKLYMEGLSTDDFEPVFRELVGETAALSPNAIVRLRTDVTQRMKRRDSALYLVFKVTLRLSDRWRPLNGGRNLMGLLVDGARFEDGILTELPVNAEEAVAA